MRKLFIYIAPLLILASCAKDLGSYNDDQKNPIIVPAAPLFSNALKALTDNVTSPSVNINVFRFWIQQWTATTYQDEPQYDFVTRNIPQNFWRPFYREALMDLQESKKILTADDDVDDLTKSNQTACIEIASVYVWAGMVNAWGDLPYSQALNIEEYGQPVYDDAATIYTDLFARLDAAIAAIDTEGDGFGDADLLYNGNMTAWLKFAHSLRLKMAITLADVNADEARAIISESASHAFASNADNASFAYQTSTPNNNPVSNALNSMFTSRRDYVAGKPFVDKLNSLNDPRRPFYFTAIGGAYVGGGIGVNNEFANTSSPSAKVIAPNFEALLMDYAEVEFILAEAAERWGIGSATEHYNKAIEASIIYWGGSAAQVSSYLAQSTVAYGTAAGNWKEKIGTQKWLALYNRGFDSWVEWRRLDYPQLSRAVGAVTPNIPYRLTYPTSEYTLNEANVNAAVVKLGADDVSHKVFWDVN